MMKQDVLDIKVAAFEGGINYWASIERTPRSYRDSEFNYCDTWNVVDHEEGKVSPLTDVALRKGIVAAAKLRGMSVAVFIENHDAGMADDAVQFALFGQIVYG